MDLQLSFTAVSADYNQTNHIEDVFHPFENASDLCQEHQFVSTSAELNLAHAGQYQGHLDYSNYMVPFAAGMLGNGSTLLDGENGDLGGGILPPPPGGKDDDNQLPVGDAVLPLLCMALIYCAVKKIKCMRQQHHA